MEVNKLFVATKAFIRNEGKILIIRESTKYTDGTNAGKFDVPGGRMQPGTTHIENLKREIREEIGIEIKIKKPFFVNEWYPKIKDEQWQIVGIFFECTPLNTDIKLGEDHEEYSWIDPKDYKNYNLIENLQLAFEKYLEQ